METIKVDTKITFEDYKKFSWFTLLKKGKRIKTLYILLPVVLLIAFISLIISVIMSGFDMTDNSTILLLVTFLFVPLYYIAIRYSISKNYKTNRLLIESLNHYEFFEDKFNIEATSSNMHNSSEYTYQQLFSVCETKTAFYLFLSKTVAHIISKRDINPSDVQRLSLFLQQKIREKYIECY